MSEFLELCLDIVRESGNAYKDGAPPSKVEVAARALLTNAGGLLLPYRAYKDGDTIRLECPKADVVALLDALEDVS